MEQQGMLELTEQQLEIGYDSDGVIAAFDEWLAKVAIERGIITADEAVRLIFERKQFKIDHPDVQKLMYEQGFYRNIPIMPGAKEKVLDAMSRGHIVTIVTSAHLKNMHSYGEKALWYKQHFDDWGLHRLIIVTDKSMVQGHVLVDDKPHQLLIKDAAVTPLWEHIRFDQSYNREDVGRRITWDTHDSVIFGGEYKSDTTYTKQLAELRAKVLATPRLKLSRKKKKSNKR